MHLGSLVAVCLSEFWHFRGLYSSLLIRDIKLIFHFDGLPNFQETVSTFCLAVTMNPHLKLFNSCGDYRYAEQCFGCIPLSILMLPSEINISILLVWGFFFLKYIFLFSVWWTPISFFSWKECSVCIRLKCGECVYLCFLVLNILINVGHICVITLKLWMQHFVLQPLLPTICKTATYSE